MFRTTGIYKKSNRSSGLLETRKGVVKTPVFVPLATKGAVKNLIPHGRTAGSQIGDNSQSQILSAINGEITQINPVPSHGGLIQFLL